MKELFQGAFFKISTALGVVDILTFVVSYPNLKMPLCTLFADFYLHAIPGFWVNICNFLAYYLNYTRGYLLVANAANRLTALMFPHKYDYYWSKFLIPVLVICFLLGLPGSYHVLLATPHIYPFSLSSNDSFILTSTFTLYKVSSSFNGAIQAFVTAMVSLVLNTVSLYLLRKTIIAKTKKLPRTQIKLFFITLSDFFIEMIWTIHQIWAYTFVVRKDMYNPIFDILYLIAPWLSDFLSLTRPYIILALCRQARTIFINAAEAEKMINMQSSAIRNSAIPSVSKVTPEVNNFFKFNSKGK